jgi:DNA-binding NarL/FixJ family response regulator
VVADDNELVRRLVVTALARETDFEVVGEATTGLEALERAEDGDVDLLVLDISMPGLDGLEVLERLQSSRPALCVVVYTGLTFAAVEREARRLGARDVVTKDVPLAELLLRLRAAS